jgi:hypothetical protein
MATHNRISARYAAKRVLQAAFVVVMIAGMGIFAASRPVMTMGLVVFAIGLSGFVAASSLSAR